MARKRNVRPAEATWGAYRLNHGKQSATSTNYSLALHVLATTPITPMSRGQRLCLVESTLGNNGCLKRTHRIPNPVQNLVRQVPDRSPHYLPLRQNQATSENTEEEKNEKWYLP